MVKEREFYFFSMIFGFLEVRVGSGGGRNTRKQGRFQGWGFEEDGDRAINRSFRQYQTTRIDRDRSVGSSL